MVRDAEATRKRLLGAAAAEFAEYGIAGARVDRIAAEAQSNKAQIYHYFGSKDGLFDAVFTALVNETVREVPIDASDLPEYAGRLFDGYEDHPEVQRLVTWYRLERAGTSAPIASVVESTESKARVIAQAQRDGLIPAHFDPMVLLGLVLHLSGLWAATTPELAPAIATTSRADRRRVVTDAVRALLV